MNGSALIHESLDVSQGPGAERKRLSRQRVCSLDFEVEWGFWNSSNGMTTAAFSATGSRAVPSA